MKLQSKKKLILFLNLHSLPEYDLSTILLHDY